MDSMKDAHEMNGGKLWGRATPEAYGRIQNFMLEAKLIEKTLPPASYMIAIPGFYEKINAFDANVVRQQAANCPVK
jgi:NitT/TauT family transport system substrate-binding protein